MVTKRAYRPQKRPIRYLAAAAAAVTTATLVLSGCSSSGSPGDDSSGGSGSTSTSATGSGAVNVLYAGSLVDLMEKQVGPGYEKSTGFGFAGFAGGSTDLAADIKGKTRKADVFVSASPAADTVLQGSSNGNWVRWYATFARAPLVLGYNPKSAFASQLRTKPWYDVVTESGFRLGKTDPATDPKGALADQALTDTAKAENLPALATLAKSQSGVYPEETLVGRLQAGQLDAGFFYSAEATAANIKTVPLTGTHLAATYTATVVNGAPNEQGAEAFVKYLLGPAGRAVLKQDGFELVSPATVTGSGVPSSLSSVLPST